jgi:hypothetical protein
VRHISAEAIPTPRWAAKLRREKVCGNMSVAEGLVNGPWDDQRYLIAEPGWRVVARYDEGIIAAKKWRRPRCTHTPSPDRTPVS